GIDRLVEDAGALDLIAGAQAHGRRQLAGELRAGAAAGVAEARPDLLLERARDGAVGRRRSEQAWLAVRAEHAVFGHAERSVRGQLSPLVEHLLRGPQMERHAGEQADRAVLPEQIAPRDLERASGCDVEAVGGLLEARANHAHAALEAGPVHDRGGGRLLDDDEQVAPRGVAVAELGDLNSPKEPERGQTASALDLRRLAEWVTGPERQRPLDHGRAGPHVADDEHMVDDGAWPLTDHKQRLGARAVRAEPGGRLDDGGEVAAIGVLLLD